MKIIKVEVDWKMNLGNLPTLEITVDKLPTFKSDEPIYTRQSNGMVHAIKEGIVDFIYMGAPTESGLIGGFGGREFVRTLTDGTVLKSRECWSGNSGNVDFWCMEVIVRETSSEYKNIGVGTAITYNLAKILINDIPDTYMTSKKLGDTDIWVLSRSPEYYTKDCHLTDKEIK